MKCPIYGLPILMEGRVMFYNKAFSFCFAFLAFCSSALAQDDFKTKFITPLACDYGENCWPVNYVDVDISDNVADFKCGERSYNAHKGTDFAVRFEDLNKGVDVLAVADGTVLRVRDQQIDSIKSPEEQAELKKQKKECGNGVLIDHGSGLKTIYCHLKQGSVVVAQKQDVKAGEKIAQVGLSGVTEFPHLHLGVFWEDSVIDPFTGLTHKDGCGKMKAPLWHEGLPVSYEPVVIFDGGFRSGPPDFNAINAGQKNPDTIDINSAGFVFWAGFYNVEEGDVVDLQITDPDGQVFITRRDEVPETRTRQYYYTGRKIGRVQLKQGEYKAKAKISRGEDIIREQSYSVNVR